jgi:8-oxo-dGTP pyrophosphatase MutT (NUDIX family)
MKKSKILTVQKDSSIPWFEQIQKTVYSPYSTSEIIYYSIKPSDYVTVLALLPDGRIILVKQYRPVVEDFTYELPSGHIEKGETPTQAVIRELKEETNCSAKSVTLLGEIVPDTGRLENRLWAFYTKDIELNQFPDPDENEGIEVSLVEPDKLFRMINDGEFNHALDLCVLTLAISKRYLII